MKRFFSNIVDGIKNFTDTNGIAIISLLIIISSGSLFIRTADYGFVWDDKPLYINEVNFPKDSVFKNIPSSFIPERDKMFIPLTKTAWALAAAIGEPEWNGSGELVFNPRIFHIFNIIFHILNCLLVFLILSRLLDNKWGAFAGALIFSLHPAQVESVAWVSELRGLMSAFFGFLAILQFISYRRNNNKILYLNISLLLIILSMLSKPTGVIFPFIILFIDIFGLENKLKGALKSSFFLMLASVPFILASMYSESQSVFKLEASWQDKGLLYLDAVAFYLYKLVFPVNLAATYGRTNALAMSSWYFNYTGIITGIIIILLIWKRKASKIFALSFIIFLLGFITVSGLIPFYYQYWSNVADRYMYISIFGAALAFAYLTANLNGKKIAITLTLVISGILYFLSFLQIPAWRSDETLWTDAINKYPGLSPGAYTGRGMAYLEQKKYGEAMKDFDMTIKIDSTYPDAFLNRGNVYFDKGEFEKAAKEYTLSLKYDRLNRDKAFYNRAKAYYSLEYFNKAVSDFSMALKLSPKDPSVVYSDRGTAYARLSEQNIVYLDSAIADFKRALNYNPADRISYDNLTQAVQLKKKYDEYVKARQDSLAGAD